MAVQQGVIMEWLSIIRGEFHEIPGLHLTRREFERLWGLDSLTCDAIIIALEDAGFLRRTPTGGYVRADSPA